MPIDTLQPTSQRMRPTLVFTRHDPRVIAEALQEKGHVETIEFRGVPESFNPEVYARLMALRVTRWNRTIAIDINLGPLSIDDVMQHVPDKFRERVIALTPHLGHQLAVPTVHIPVPVSY